MKYKIYVANACIEDEYENLSAFHVLNETHLFDCISCIYDAKENKGNISVFKVRDSRNKWQIAVVLEMESDS